MSLMSIKAGKKPLGLISRCGPIYKLEILVKITHFLLSTHTLSLCYVYLPYTDTLAWQRVVTFISIIKKHCPYYQYYNKAKISIFERQNFVKSYWITLNILLMNSKTLHIFSLIETKFEIVSLRWRVRKFCFKHRYQFLFSFIILCYFYPWWDV